MTDGLCRSPVGGTDAGLREALAQAGLPTDDLAEPERLFFCFNWDGRRVGYGGIELHGEDALLRSLVVLPAERGQGFGAGASRLLLQEAKRAGASRAYLLTESAEAFFASLGFARIERADASAAILATRQAATLCPASAAMMVRSTR